MYSDAIHNGQYPTGLCLHGRLLTPSANEDSCILERHTVLTGIFLGLYAP